MKGLEAVKILYEPRKQKYIPVIVRRNACRVIEKELKALEIIVAKRVDMWDLMDLLDQTYDMYVAFCKGSNYAEDYILTEEEFNLLKEVLENDNSQK